MERTWSEVSGSGERRKTSMSELGAHIKMRLPPSCISGVLVSAAPTLRLRTSCSSPAASRSFSLSPSKSAMSSSVESPWHAAYPAPRNTTPDGVSPAQLLELLCDDEKRIVLVDLRRNDHEGGTIQGSINLPAQSLYPSIPSLYSLFAASNVSRIIWYCSSSKGRGNRAAGWFSDYLEDQKNSDMKSLVLTGGIKGWVAAGDGFRDRMVEFNPAKW